MANIEIRKADLSDLEFVSECAREAYEKYVAVIGKKPAPMIADFSAQITKGQVWIGEFEDTPIGYIVMYPQQQIWHVENVAVLPVAQGMGAGKALMDFAERQARIMAALEVRLYTNVKMTDNLDWYPQIGFQETGRAQEDGFHRVFYTKFLSK